MMHLNKKCLHYVQLCYGRLMITLLLVHYVVALTVDSKVVWCVGTTLSVFDFITQRSRVMVTTEGIYQMTTLSENKQRRSTEKRR